MIVTANLISTASTNKLIEYWNASAFGKMNTQPENLGTLADFMSMSVNDRMQWLNFNVSSQPRLQASGVQGVLSQPLPPLRPLAMSLTTTARVSTVAHQLGIPSTGIFMK
jgi:hypothetical protein